MNCWKTIDVSRDIGNHKLSFISLIATFISFIIIYLSMSIINSHVQLKGDSIHLFLIGLFFLVPIHKLYQAIPILIWTRKINVTFQLKYFIFLNFKIKQCNTISRRLSIFSLLFPIFGVTMPLLYSGIIYPEYMHYFSILVALHIGISIRDYLYLYMFVRAPRKSQIDNYNDGFNILIHK